MTPTAQKETALHPTKDNSAAPAITQLARGNPMQCTTNRRRWNILSCWARQRVESEMTYVLGEV